MSDSWDPVDCSPPGSSVLGISQARTLEWVTISFSKGSFWCRDRACIFCGRWIFLPLSYLGSPLELSYSQLNALEGKKTSHHLLIYDVCSKAERVGCRFLALWQVMSLQGLWCDYVEAAFINGSWSWPWESMASSWVSGLENPSGLCHDACGWECAVMSWPWVPSMLPAGRLARRSLAELEICMSQGCWVGKLLYAGLPLWGLLVAKSFRDLSSQYFPQPPNTPMKAYFRSCCLSPGSRPSLLFDPWLIVWPR